MGEKYITEEDIRQILEPIVDKVKSQMVDINNSAVEQFYGTSSGSYGRTGSFSNVVQREPQIEYSGNGCTLTYTYSSSDVAVNSWSSSWGITYPGNPEYAFISGFEHGSHGGPKPTTIESLYDFQNIKTKGGWTWAKTNVTTPIIELIEQGMNNLDI